MSNKSIKKIQVLMQGGRSMHMIYCVCEKMKQYNVS